MTLDVSGPEFVSTLNRMAFAACELVLPEAIEGELSTIDDCAATVLDVMCIAQRRGWPLGQRILEILRAASAPRPQR